MLQDFFFLLHICKAEWDNSPWTTCHGQFTAANSPWPTHCGQLAMEQVTRQFNNFI